jgi:hypothetical protein
VGPGADQDGCGKSRPHRDSIPGPYIFCRACQNCKIDVLRAVNSSVLRLSKLLYTYQRFEGRFCCFLQDSQHSENCSRSSANDCCSNVLLSIFNLARTVNQYFSSY